MSLEHTYPPPASVTQPRQLNRWLDVRPQGGSLERTHGYFNVPVFSIANTWLGFSTIVGAFNYTSDRNFSLRLDALEVPTNPNYTLCISWVNSDNEVFRYSIWRAEDDLFNFGLEAYAGQLIMKNFRIEIWNAQTSPVTNAAVLPIYSTLLGNFDYMYGQDYTIATPSALCEGQSYEESVVAAPSDLNRLFWWTASEGVTPGINGGLITDWVDRDNAYNLEPAVLGPTYRATGVGNFNTTSLEFTSFTELTVTQTLLSIQHLFFTFKSLGGVGKVLEFTYAGLVAIVSQPEANTKVKLELGLSDVTTDDVLGTDPGVVEIIIGSSGNIDTINIYNALTRGIVQSTKSLTVYPLIAMDSLELGDQAAGGGFLISDFIAYSTVLPTPDRTETLEYLFNLFGTASAIPLTPATCAQPTLN